MAIPSYLFEELSRHELLTSDFFSNEKQFLRGIDGQADPERVSRFREALAQARRLAWERQKTHPNGSEALSALTLAAGMGSNAESILQKRHVATPKRTKEANEYAKRLLARNPGPQTLTRHSAWQTTSSDRWVPFTASQSGLMEFTETRNSGWSSSPIPQRVAFTSKPFAKIMLAVAARRKNQNGLAQKLLRELTEQYPGNLLFASEYAKPSSTTLQ